MLGTISTNIKENKRIKKLLHENIIVSVSGAEEYPRNTNMFNLDARDDEVRPTLMMSLNLSSSVITLYGR